MRPALHFLQLWILVSSSFTKEVELPQCPTNINYLPQNLPMHCRMTRSARFPNLPPNILPPFYQSPPSDKASNSIAIPVPPGFPPRLPPGMQLNLPPGMQPGLPPGSPPSLPPGLSPGLSGPVPIPMPMPMAPPGAPSHKLPVIVMPFYSPDPSFKKSNIDHGHIKRKVTINRRRKRRRGPHYDPDASSDSDGTDDDLSDGSSDDSSSENGFWHTKRGFRRNRSRKHKRKKAAKNKQKKNLLTPLLQYVTKDGYVIFEKKISNGEAKDWLKLKSDDPKNQKGRNQKVEIVPEVNQITSNKRAHEKNNKDVEAEGLEVQSQKEPARRHRLHKTGDKKKSSH